MTTFRVAISGDLPAADGSPFDLSRLAATAKAFAG